MRPRPFMLLFAASTLLLSCYTEIAVEDSPCFSDGALVTTIGSKGDSERCCSEFDETSVRPTSDECRLYYLDNGYALPIANRSTCELGDGGGYRACHLDCELGNNCECVSDKDCTGGAVCDTMVEAECRNGLSGGSTGCYACRPRCITADDCEEGWSCVAGVDGKTKAIDTFCHIAAE